jgi:purine-binding chemotaxis protein CheW
MSDTGLQLSRSAAELRHAFDASFAKPLEPDRSGAIDFIAITVGGDKHAIRLAEVAGLHADVKVTPFPSRVASLHGLAGFRGATVPVYDLASLLGYGRAADLRWLILAAGAPAALAFEAFESHFRVPPAMVATRADAESARFVREIVRSGDFAWPVIHLPSVIEAIRRQLSPAPPRKER